MTLNKVYWSLIIKWLIYTSWNADISKNTSPVCAAVRQWWWWWCRWGWWRCRTQSPTEVALGARLQGQTGSMTFCLFTLLFCHLNFYQAEQRKEFHFSGFNSMVQKGSTCPLNIEIWKQWTPTQRGNWKAASSPQLRRKVLCFKDTMKHKNIDLAFISMKGLMNEWMKLGHNWLIKHSSAIIRFIRHPYQQVIPFVSVK